MSNWKKALLAFKVFLPIIIKSVINLWEEIMDAYDKNNIAELQKTAALVEQYSQKEKI